VVAREASCSCGQLRVVAVPIGTFADPTFPPSAISVWEERRHPWVAVPDGAERPD
jgi:hypothetical protein